MVARALIPLLLVGCSLPAEDPPSRPRARDLGIVVGRLPTGPHNAITDVAGVKVGHVTLVEGDDIRTGITAVLPHGGDLFERKVPAAFDCYNGFGKPFGTVQIRELGRIETPVLLGSTLSVPRIADAVMTYVLESDKSGEIRSINPAVGETNDGYLSDGRSRPIRPEHVLTAIREAKTGPVEEGAVGAGTGTRCFGYKGGIGTSSRRVRVDEKVWTVGVLVQTNFGGELRILGHALPQDSVTPKQEKGSCAMVVATDAPLDSRQLRRLARRTFAGMARAGASFSHGSGDYAFAFSTAVPNASDRPVFSDAALSPLLVASADATQEAIYNSLLKAHTVRGRSGRVARAISIEKVHALRLR